MMRNLCNCQKTKFVMLFMIVFNMPAFTCSYVKQTYEQYFQRSEQVFRVMITGAELPPGANKLHQVILTFKLQEVFKGQAPSSRQFVNVQFFNCQNRLYVGGEYILFIKIDKTNNTTIIYDAFYLDSYTYTVSHMLISGLRKLRDR